MELLYIDVYVRCQQEASRTVWLIVNWFNDDSKTCFEEWEKYIYKKKKKKRIH